MSFRIGNGFDLHRLQEGLPLILGGVNIPHAKGSVAHSDGDVVTHAIIDALLGAASLGDIGCLFPPSDESIKGIDSMEMLSQVVAMLAENGYSICNVDATIVCEAPKLSPHYQSMKERLSAILKVSANDVSIKAKTAERLGDIGNGLAIAAYAVSLIERKP